MSRYYSGPVSDHFDGERFFDPQGAPPRNRRDLLPLADRSLLARHQGEMAGLGAVALCRPAAATGRRRHVPHLLCGHASFLVQTAGLNILLDPVWSTRASPFRRVGPKRVNDPGIAFADLPPIDVVLVSHAHYDHLDVATLSRLAAAHRPRVITPLGNDTIMRAHDKTIAAEAYDWHDRVDIGRERRGDARSDTALVGAQSV